MHIAYKTQEYHVSVHPRALNLSSSDTHLANMTPSKRRESLSSKSSTSKTALEHVEENTPGPEQFLPLFPVLQDKNPEELELLNKSVLRKLDWQFLPCVTMMLLMR